MFYFAHVVLTVQNDRINSKSEIAFLMLFIFKRMREGFSIFITDFLFIFANTKVIKFILLETVFTIQTSTFEDNLYEYTQ